MKCRSLLQTLVLAGTGFATLGAFGQASPITPGTVQQSYPSRPVRLFIGQVPGGAVDTVARLVAERLSARLGQPVVAENKPGTGGMLAAESIARAAPDSYSIGLLDVGALAVNPVLQRRISYDVAKDFRYVGTVARIPLVMVAKPGLSFSPPGGPHRVCQGTPVELSYGCAGVGSPPRLAFETYKQREASS